MARNLACASESTGLRPVLACGSLILLGYVGLFGILQTPVLWYALRPDPIRSLFPDAFRPINELFPNSWVNLERTDPLALLVVTLYIAVLALITAPVLYFVWRLTRHKLVLNGTSGARSFVFTVVLFTLAFMLVLLFVRGLVSTDIYSYTWYSRILAVHGASPMTHAPAEFPPDPEGAVYWIGWPDEPSVYGPAWTLVSTLFFALGNAVHPSFSAQLLSLRLLSDLAHLLNGMLVWSIAGHLTSRPVHIRQRIRASTVLPRLAWSHAGARPAFPIARREQITALGVQSAALVFYLWNPLLLIEFAGSGHNDVLMITFVLLAIWLHLRRAWPLAAAALVLATLVKLPALFLVPGYLWYLFWRGHQRTAGSDALRRATRAIGRPLAAVAIMLLTAAILYVPFWEGLRTVVPPFSGPASRLYLHTLAYDIWRNGPQITADALGASDNRAEVMESVRDFLNANLRWSFTAALGVAAIALTWGVRTFPRLLVSWGWLMLLAAILQGWYWPWYASWSIALAAIAPSSRLRVASIVLAISSLLLYPEEQILAHHFPLFLDWSGVFVVLPTLLYIGGSCIASRRRSHPVHRLPIPARGSPPVQSRPSA